MPFAIARSVRHLQHTLNKLTFMNDFVGPRIRLQTRPALLDKKPFHLEWHLPLEPGLPTHAALFDLQPTFPGLIAESEGGDEAETLLSLWTTLIDRSVSLDAIAYVAGAYFRRAGRQPERAGSGNE